MSSLALIASACGKDGDKGAEEGEDAPLAPALGVLELPVSLRTGDPAPDNAFTVEANPNELRAEGKVVTPLENGAVPKDKQANGIIAPLKAALTGGRAHVALKLHSSLPYETIALILNTANSVGVRHATFEVRKPGGGSETGWLRAENFTMTPRTVEEVKFANIPARSWNDFPALWEDIYNGCRTSQSGSCAYVQENVAEGGKLQIVLHASGRGVNINFHRVGFTAEQLAEERQKQEAALAEKKKTFLDGRMSQTDLEKALLEGAPATQALFQFRDKEAFASPSALSATIAPACGKKACGVVVSADRNTMGVRIMSLIGAAFPDGAAPPTLAFEQPWTEKPKIIAPPTPEGEPEAAAEDDKTKKKK
jgi:hypothetical protein